MAYENDKVLYWNEEYWARAERECAPEESWGWKKGDWICVWGWADVDKEIRKQELYEEWER